MAFITVYDETGVCRGYSVSKIICKDWIITHTEPGYHHERKSYRKGRSVEYYCGQCDEIELTNY